MTISLFDKLVVVAAALLCVLSFYWFWQGEEGVPQYVEIRSTGERQRYSLLEEREFEVRTALGSSLIEIRNGQARFASSSCNRQLCVLAGWLSRSGQFAACLPNGISLQLVGQNQYDAINF